MHPRHSGWTLLLSIALWAPTARVAMAGDIDLIPALVRYFAALAVATVAVMAVTHLTTGYRRAATAAQQALVSAPQEGGTDEAEPAPADAFDTTAVLEAVTALEPSDS